MKVDQTQELYEAIVGSGFYPGVATADVRRLLAGAPVRAQLVLTEVRVDSEDGLQMEAQVLAVTDDRVVFWGAYEEPGTGGEPPRLQAHARVLPLRKVNDVRILSSVSNPAEFAPEDVPDAVRLVIIADQLDRVAVEAVYCDDDDCGGGHGFHGDVVHDALVFAETRDAVGADKLAELLEFGSVLSTAISAR